MLDKNEWIRPWAGSDDEVTKMLDIKLIRENPDKIKAGLKAKEVDCDELIDRILELDEQRRTLLQQTEALKAEQNKVSKQIPALKKAGEDTTAIFKEDFRAGRTVKRCCERVSAGFILSAEYAG